MPRIIPEPRYFSIPSVVVGGVAFQKPRAELHAMGAIVGPFAARLDELAGGDHRGMTDDSDRITLATRLYAQHAEAVVFIMKCYPLNEAGEDFRLWVRVCRHRVSDALLRDARRDQRT